MQEAWLYLIGTAATVGLLHTLVGVDHTLPFVVLGRANGWHLSKLLWITTLCGIAHVFSSVLIGGIGIGLGVAVDRLEWLESLRGGLAAWLLIGFGLAYAVWGWVHMRRRKRHTHAHAHDDGTVHKHDHDHRTEHAHVHGSAASISVLGLFVVFVLGPCEVLIPMLMAPAFSHNWYVVASVVVVFAAATLATMLTLVTLGHYGMQWRKLRGLEQHIHALSGAAIALSGVALQVLGI
jgi:sulfite exporter TauE/SafE